MAEHAEAAAAMLKAMAHPARLMVMCRLVQGEAAVAELASGLALSQQHLAVLRELDLVRTRRQSQSIMYSLSPGPALGVMQALHEAFCSGRD